MFAALNVEEQDDIVLEEVEMKSNEEVATFLKTTEKEAVKTYVERDVVYPMIEIILDEESRLDVVRKEALEDMLVGEMRDVSVDELSGVVKSGGEYEQLSVAISFRDKFAVKGKIQREQLSHFYSLLVGMKMKLHINENDIYEKERILALM